MKIRKANKFDLPFFQEAVLNLHNKDHNSWSRDLTVDQNHNNILYQTLLFGEGTVFIAEKDNEPIGMIAGYISPFLWKPNVKIMYQILFYISDKHKSSRVGYKLIDAYNKEGQRLMKENKIYKYSFTASEPMFNLDLEKFNYKLVEKNWIVGE
jgi:hypothetical protein